MAFLHSDTFWSPAWGTATNDILVNGTWTEVDIRGKMCVDIVLWQFDQAEAALVHDTQACPKEDDFATFHGQEEVLG